MQQAEISHRLSTGSVALSPDRRELTNAPSASPTTNIHSQSTIGRNFEKYAFTLRAFGLASLHVKPAQLVAVSLGGLVFGVGMVLLGYCPGTGVAAAAEGKTDALFGVVGMMLGALLFAAQFSFFGKNVLTWIDLGPVTLPELTRIPAWAIFVGLTAGAVMLFRQIEGWERR